MKNFLSAALCVGLVTIAFENCALAGAQSSKIDPDTGPVTLSDDLLDSVTAGREIVFGIFITTWDPCLDPGTCGLILGGVVTEDPPGSGQFFVHRERELVFNQAIPEIGGIDIDIEHHVTTPRLHFDLAIQTLD